MRHAPKDDCFGESIAGVLQFGFEQLVIESLWMLLTSWW